MRILYPAAGLLLLLTGCQQQTTAGNIVLPGAGKTEVSHSRYQCDDRQTLEVTYYRSATNMLAIAKKGSEPAVVMTNVMSGSGARYTGNIYQWWTKGQTGTFSNLMDERETECRSV